MAKYDDDNKKVPIKYTARDFASIKSELEDFLISYQSLFLEQLFCQLHSSGLASSDTNYYG